jgi:dTDP-4-dehydrorhamnose 3,5-epimerase
MVEYKETSLDGVILITPKLHLDYRGKLIKKFHKSSFRQFGIELEVMEEIISYSSKGVLRGMHLQLINPQAKLINVIRGSIFDVIVDLRKSSKTYGKYFGIELSEENSNILYIPEGFAHGFVALEDNVIVSYLCSTEYDAGSDAGIKFDDPDIGIAWPKLDVDYILSDKDKNLPSFKQFNMAIK